MKSKWGLGKGARECIDQSFAIKLLVEKYLGRDRKLQAAFMKLEKTYDNRLDTEYLWNVLKKIWCGRAIFGRYKSFL